MIEFRIMRAAFIFTSVLSVMTLLIAEIIVLKAAVNVSGLAQQKLKSQLRELESKINEGYDIYADGKNVAQYTSYEPNQGEMGNEYTTLKAVDIEIESVKFEPNQFEETDIYTASRDVVSVKEATNFEPNQYEEVDISATSNDVDIVTESPAYEPNQYDEADVYTTPKDADMAKKLSSLGPNQYEVEAVYTTSKDLEISTETPIYEPNDLEISTESPVNQANKYEKAIEYSTVKDVETLRNSSIYEPNQDEGYELNQGKENYMYTTSKDMGIATKATIYESEQDDEYYSYNTSQYAEEFINMLRSVKMENGTNDTEVETNSTVTYFYWYCDPQHKKIVEKMLLCSVAIVGLLLLYKLVKFLCDKIINVQEIVEYPFYDENVFVITE